MTTDHADVFVQWKGTDVCLDFTCPCGFRGHFDGDFAYYLYCEGCGQVYEMPHTFGLRPVGRDAEDAQVASRHSHAEPKRSGPDVVAPTATEWGTS